MSYPYLLLICLSMMISIALFMFYLGTKISYNYILYNASISIGSGVIFFLVKMILTLNQVGPFEQILDISISMLLIMVWLVNLIETLTVEVIENSREIKGKLIGIATNIRDIEIKAFSYKIANWIKAIQFREIPSRIAKRAIRISLKSKTFLIKNKLIQKDSKING